MKMNWMLQFIPVSLALDWFHAPPWLVFLASAASIVAMALENLFGTSARIGSPTSAASSANAPSIVIAAASTAGAIRATLGRTHRYVKKPIKNVCRQMSKFSAKRSGRNKYIRLIGYSSATWNPPKSGAPLNTCGFHSAKLPRASSPNPNARYDLTVTFDPRVFQCNDDPDEPNARAAEATLAGLIGDEPREADVAVVQIAHRRHERDAQPERSGNRAARQEAHEPPVHEWHARLDRPRHRRLIGIVQQRLQIARNLVTRPRLIFMDEPTSVLTPQAVAKLFSTLRQLAAEGSDWLVLTTKGGAFARELLQAYGLEPRAVYGHEQGSKPEVLLQLSAEQPAPLWFVEDRRPTLETVRHTAGLEAVRCFLVSWGYLGPGDRDNLPEGISLLEPSTFAGPLQHWPTQA